MKNRVWTVVTLVIVIACGALLAMRMGLFRKNDLSTRIGLRSGYPAAADPSFQPVEDWPCWRGPRGDGISHESAGNSWPKDGLPVAWVADVGLGFSSPIAYQNRIYLFSLNNGKDNLTCFDAVTGAVVWSQDSTVGWTQDYEGSRATPAIAGDAIYTYGGKGELICRDLATGAKRWQQDAPRAARQPAATQPGETPAVATGDGEGSVPRWGAASSPLVAGGRVYVQAGTGGSVCVGFDAATGAPLVRSEFRGEGAYAHPILIEVEKTPQVVVFAADTVFGMNPDTGKTLWSQPWKTNYGVNASTPVYRDGMLYISSAYGKGGMMFKLTPDSATPLWPRPKTEIKSKFQGLILDGDLLCGNSDPGALYCIAWPGGEKRWKADDSSLNLGFGGSIVKAVGDKMVLMSETGTLSLTRVSAGGIELVSQFEAFPGTSQCWATPLLYGGRLYAKGMKELACYKLPK